MEGVSTFHLPRIMYTKSFESSLKFSNSSVLAVLLNFDHPLHGSPQLDSKPAEARTTAKGTSLRFFVIVVLRTSDCL